MPKAAKSSTQTLLKSKTTSSTAQAAGSSSKKRAKESKDSHLYTDDNPETTLHGTGFKDSDAAKHTIELVSKRSLTYQFQTINTMFHRAKGHPHKTPGISGAMAVFNEWLKVTYPQAKKELRAGGFKPVLSKETVAAYAPKCREVLDAPDVRFLDMYVELPKNKRLANVLLDPKAPGEKDWEQERYDTLCEVVPGGREEAKWTGEELWDDAKQPTAAHLKMIAWGWSPVPGRTLAGRAKALET
jgi:hypothetical protein